MVRGNRKDLTHNSRACTPRRGGTADCCDRGGRATAAKYSTCCSMNGISLAVWDSRGLPNHREHPISPTQQTALSIGWLRARRILDRSLWRPIQRAWASRVPVNFLLIDRCRSFITIGGDDFQSRMPEGSGQMRRCREVVLRSRAEWTRLSEGPDGSRPVHGVHRLYQDDPTGRNRVCYRDTYTAGDTVPGSGASHQTGWRCCGQNC